MKKFSIFAASVILLAGCAKENPAPAPAPDPAPGPGGEDTPDLAISISPTIAEFTKATGTHFDAGDKIGLDILVDSEAEAFKTNAELTYQGTSFSAENLIWYKDTQKTSVLTAYFPYSESGRPATTTLPADQSAGAAAYDILGATLSGVKPSETPVALTFKHLLSKVEIKIDNQTSEAVSALSIDGLILNGDLDFTALTSAATTASAASVVTPHKVSDNLYEILIPAQTASLTASVSFENGSTPENQQSLSTTLVSGKKQEWTIEVTEKTITITVTGDIQDWETGADILMPTDKNYAYKTVTLSNGQVWMAEPLRYVPQGKAVSADPNDGNGIWFPYKVVDGVAVPLTDKASIEKYGYLYDSATIFGTAIDVNNVTSFEGAQGICPDGWHIPTKVEWTYFCGYAQSATLSDDTTAAEIEVNTAPIYNVDYKGGCITNANAAGWNPVLSGCVVSGKYNLLLVSTGKNSIGSLKMNYFAGSTGYTGSKGTAVQFWALMSTFTDTYPEGRLHVAYCNAPNGVQVRCIKDGWTAK